jgi:hypothetical protein
LEGGAPSFHSGRKSVNEPYGRVATLIIVQNPAVDFSTFLSPEDFFITSICAETNFAAVVQTPTPTVIPTGAGRRFFPSFVRERVGLRSGGISLRSIAQAKFPRSLATSSRKLAGSNISNTPRQRSFRPKQADAFPLVRPRTSRPAQWRNLSSINRASQKLSIPLKFFNYLPRNRLTLNFFVAARTTHDPYPLLKTLHRQLLSLE